jgi:hypothetical protein
MVAIGTITIAGMRAVAARHHQHGVLTQRVLT